MATTSSISAAFPPTTTSAATTVSLIQSPDQNVYETIAVTASSNIELNPVDSIQSLQVAMSAGDSSDVKDIYHHVHHDWNFGDIKLQSTSGGGATTSASATSTNFEGVIQMHQNQQGVCVEMPVDLIQNESDVGMVQCLDVNEVSNQDVLDGGIINQIEEVEEDEEMETDDAEIMHNIEEIQADQLQMLNDDSTMQQQVSAESQSQDHFLQSQQLEYSSGGEVR